MYTIQVIVIMIFIIRLLFLKISKANEKNILANGGKEYGVKNSKRLTLLHILFYAACFTESIVKTAPFNRKGIWTVKLMPVHNQQYNDHRLFKTVKHPNYFLNITPELIGVALLCHALYMAIIILPFSFTRSDHPK